MNESAYKAWTAFYNYAPKTYSNTAIIVENGVSKMYLHGNLIALKNDKGQVFFTLAGWQTKTTKSRLNEALGLEIVTKKGVLYANGKEINDHDWYYLAPCGEVIKHAEKGV